MSAKKSTNKTAHVLNLISNAKTEPTETAITEDSSPDPQPNTIISSHPLVPPVLEDAHAKDEEVSEEIRNALETEFTSSNTVSKTEANTFETELKTETLVSPNIEHAQTPIPVVEASHTNVPSADKSEISTGKFTYINVMKELVEEKADEYMKMFGVCNCPICSADVRALALTNLPSKYVVISEGEIIPMLTIYEGRYHVAITAQLTNACKTVHDNPHHNRKFK